MPTSFQSPTIQSFLKAMDWPDHEYGPFPFWFWNDDLEEKELIRQLRLFRDGGVGGVVIHPRMGLSRRVGYLTEKYFHYVRSVVDACAELGMKVILYDEGSYPSGSATGQVVASNPRYAAQALALVHEEIEGPWIGYWRPHLDRSLTDQIVCVVLGRERSGVIDADSLTLLAPNDEGLVRVDVPRGSWRVMACVQTVSGGTIRGVHGDEDDGHATAPAAGDIMNPRAVQKFVALTHDAYARHLKHHFGKTVVAMFTDEPDPLGRRARKGVKPFTNQFDAYVGRILGRSRNDVQKWLPALWLNYGSHTESFRRAYDRAVHQRIVDVFYTAQSEWCERHGLHLTGHPAASNDMSSLSTFHWPGQDMVWRWVVPGNMSSLEGPHSVVAKAATSAARALHRRRVVTEIYGAYGWQLSLDEAKWLADWHLVRGNNLFLLHAFFYSIRGGRAYESEPDLGIHNVWWHHFRKLIQYIRRMSWLMTDSEHICEVAVLGFGYDLPWQVAKQLYESQIDFLYIDEAALKSGTVEQVPSKEGTDTTLRIGTQAYRTIIIDGDVPLGDDAQALLTSFQEAGGTVVMDPSTMGQNEWRAIGSDRLKLVLGHRDLRVMHVRKLGMDVWVLTNEGETTIEDRLHMPSRWIDEGMGAFWVDPLRGEVAPAGKFRGNSEKDRWEIPLRLLRRESLLLVVGPWEESMGINGGWRLVDALRGPRRDETAGEQDGREIGVAGEQGGDGIGVVGEQGGREIGVAGEQDRSGIGEAIGQKGHRLDRSGGVAAQEDHWIDVAGPWQVIHFNGDEAVISGLGDWTAQRELELFSGTLVYRTSISVAKAKGSKINVPKIDWSKIGSVLIHLGDVGEAADVWVNGQWAGSVMWTPYVVCTEPSLWRDGDNRLEIQVTNSMANRMEGAMRPSGLMGPVKLQVVYAAGVTPV